MLYASELTWKGQKSMANEYQLAINRMARATLGALPSTPLGALIAESALTPATHLLDYRQAKYAQRLLARPKGHAGPEEILERRGTQLTEQLRSVTSLARGNTAEEMTWGDSRKLQGKLVVEEKEAATKTAKTWGEKENTIWTDGSRLDDKKVGCAMVWWEPANENPDPWVGRNTGRTYYPLPSNEGWTGKRFHLGSNKEVFDAELYAIYQAVMRFAQREEYNTEYTIFADSTSAIQRCKTDHLGAGQQFARATIKWSEDLASRGCTLTIRWVPSHANIEGNETADVWAKEAATCEMDAVDKTYLNETSVAFMTRKATENRSDGTKKWVKEKSSKRTQYQPPKKKGMRKALMKERKSVASRYYQLLTGHAITASYLFNKIKKIDSDLCWWCDSIKKQTRHHLFVECDKWKSQQKVLWKNVGKALGWKHPKILRISDLFGNEKATEPVLQFLRDTDVGKPLRIAPPASESDGGSEGSDEE
jgi:ribonuclease HI